MVKLLKLTSSYVNLRFSSLKNHHCTTVFGVIWTNFYNLLFLFVELIDSLLIKKKCSLQMMKFQYLILDALIKLTAILTHWLNVLRIIYSDYFNKIQFFLTSAVLTILIKLNQMPIRERDFVFLQFISNQLFFIFNFNLA